MANRRRGEIDAMLGGRRRRLCLTLGALAELEDAFGAEDLTALAVRFGSGRLTSRDLMRILEAGLKGGGDGPPPDVADLGRDEDIASLAAIVADLLAVTFGVAGGGAGQGEVLAANQSGGEGAAVPRDPVLADARVEVGRADLRPSSESSGPRPSLEGSGSRPSSEGSSLRPSLEGSGLRPSSESSGLRPNPEGSGLRPQAPSRPFPGTP